MQLILNEEIKSKMIKTTLSKNLVDVLIGSECHHRIEITESGDMEFYRVDSRDAIYIELEDDDFLEKSPLKGAKIRMTIGDILRKFNLTEDQRNQLENLRRDPTKAGTIGYPNAYTHNGQTCVDVIHIQWKSVRPQYFKHSPKTKSQLEFDPTTTVHISEIPVEQYEENKEYYDKQVEKGAFTIEIKWIEDLWEAVALGTDGENILYGKRKSFQMRKYDQPGNVIDMEYGGFLFGTVDGVRISLQQILHNFENMFDIVMYQILREVNKIKGRIFVFNKGGLTGGSNVKKILYDATNDGFIEVDGSADGNMSGEKFDLNQLVQEKDWGLSNSFQTLLALKADIKNMIDQLTGLNEYRDGDIPASATSSNAQQAIAGSKTITEPLVYGFQQYCEKTLMKICETSKITWAFYKTEKARQILGDTRHSFLVEVQKILGYSDYGVHLEDSGKFMEAKQRVMQHAEASLNAKELRLQDVFKIDMAETIAEAEAVLNTSWEAIQKIAKEQQQAEIQARKEEQERALAAAKEAAKEDREDRQAHDLQKIDVKAKADLLVKTGDAKNKLLLDQNKADNEEFSAKNMK
jgi:hypothetical protein